jgi:hypothetical protein
VKDVGVGVVSGEDEHLNFGALGFYLARRRNAVHSRHAEVHKNHIRSEPQRERDSLDAVGGLGDDLEIRLAVEDAPQAGADDGVIVADQQPDGILRHRS